MISSTTQVSLLLVLYTLFYYYYYLYENRLKFIHNQKNRVTKRLKILVLGNNYVIFINDSIKEYIKMPKKKKTCQKNS